MFEEFIRKSSEEFKEVLKGCDRVRVITHLDADGLSSGFLMIRFLEDIGKDYHLTILKQLYSDIIERIGKRDDVIVFLDLGSGKLDEIEENFGGNVFVIDHHKPRGNGEKLKVINPFLFGVDGDTQITSSGITYLFLKEVYPNIIKDGFAAISGVFGDSQDPKSGINKEILDELVEGGVIDVRIGLRVFGRTYKPIHKALAYSFDPFLPGITGNEEEALKVIKESGIEYKIGNLYKTISDLSIEEEKELISNIIIKAVEEGKRINPKEILGEIYLVKGRKGILSDCREIATVLNAFGRLGRGWEAILVLLGKVEERRAYEVLEEYSKVISNILRKIDEGGIELEEEKDVLIVHGKDLIKEEFVSTIASVISKNNPGRLVVCYGVSEDGYYKMSLRSNRYDCEEIARRISERYGLEGGGHKQASGIKVNKGLLDDVLSEIKKFIG